MEPVTIQTLHPDKGKSNKIIASDKYEIIKVAILEILEIDNPTHTQLMEELHHKLHRIFDGNTHWYGETVKLDLEARKLIERTKTKPEKYKLTTTSTNMVRHYWDRKLLSSPAATWQQLFGLDKHR